MSRSEIDTSAPFKSVKEAVALFGERVLAGEVYANKRKQIRHEDSEDVSSPVIIELKETKQRLVKAREDRMLMATCLSSLQNELERTKYELQQLKESSKVVEEDLKYIQDVEVNTIDHSGVEFHNKRYVTFAKPPTVEQIMMQSCDATVLERHPSLKKKKKKPIFPLIGGIFTRKKNIIHV